MEQQFVQFVSGLDWRDLVTIAGLLFGLLSLAAYLEQRRSTKQTTTLAKWAELSIDKSVSESQINELVAQKMAMEEQVTRSIPALARAAVLKEQIHVHERALGEHFVARQKALAELASAAPGTGLDRQLEQAILDRIVPAYQQRQEENRLRTRITVLSVGVGAVSTILPFGIGSILAILVAPALLGAAVRLQALNQGKVETFQMMGRWIPWGYAVAVFSGAGFGGMLMNYGYRVVMADSGPTYIKAPEFYVGLAIVMVSLVVGLAYPFIRRRISHALGQLIGVNMTEGRGINIPRANEE